MNPSENLERHPDCLGPSYSNSAPKKTTVSSVSDPLREEWIAALRTHGRLRSIDDVINAADESK